MEALPGTIVLAISAMLIAIIFGIPLGILAAVKKDTWMDSSSIFVSVLGIPRHLFLWEL
jgi:peptide/nickel transport system permease protein